MDVNDLLTVTITITLRGIEKNGDQETLIEETYEQCFGVGLEDHDETQSIITDMAEAIDDGNLYGWMQQEKMNAMILGGDLRQETIEELTQAITKEHKSQVIA